MRRLVSVVMPAYNAERYIAESIRSVQRQTYADWELVVVDDGSTDRTAEVVRDFTGSDPRIKYLFRENGGQGKARNAAIESSNGDLIAFLDADDLWEREKLALQVKTLEETGADVVLSDAVIFNEGEAGGGTTFSEICADFLFGRHEGAEAFRLLFAYNRIPILTVLARKEKLYEAGLFDETVGRCFPGRNTQICEDYDLWLKLARRGAVFYGMTERLARYRRHPGATVSDDGNLLKATAEVVRKHSRDNGLEPFEVKRTVRGMYRNLISTLVAERRIEEARAYVKELSEWDEGGLVTPLQRILIRVAPGQFNFISRVCLYRIEWHVGRLFGR
jgi:teichuronic acid biosynthesis glycosyltransferase TuaG